MAQEHIDKKIDVWLLTGYLGAGKTTAVNALLRREQFAGKRLALVINEFGKMGIDGQLLEPGDYEKFEINKGSIFCICTKTDFIASFQKIRELQIDTVVIEATGIAETSDIEQLLSEKVLEGDFQIRANVCIVDGVNFIKTAAFLKAALSQVQSADGIVINKKDCLSKPDICQLKDVLSELNPSATMTTAEFGNMTSDFLESLTHKRQEKPLFTCPPVEIPTVFIQSEQIFNRDCFREALDSLKDNILRLKGDVQFEDGCRFVEVVGGQYTEQESKGAFGSQTAFTVIGWKIEKPALQAAFEKLIETEQRCKSSLD